MNEEEAKNLIRKYNAGQCTEAEKTLLDQWYMQYEETEIPVSSAKIEELGWEIYSQLPKAERKYTTAFIWPGIASAAAIVVLMLSLWTYFYKTKPDKPSSYTSDIAPGTNKATLTLSNGKTIDLSGTKRGIAINGGELSYNDGEKLKVSSEPELGRTSSISTPLGGTYQITLSDGSKAWLNAQSTLKFPTSFNGAKQRVVEVTGEVYFEIAKSYIKRIPFIVITSGQKVQVLGTHFNINAYDLRAVKTTLLEGSVQVASEAPQRSTKAAKAVLTPGQQAIFTPGKDVLVKHVDTRMEVAWKNGRIEFEDADLKTILNMLKRWYAIQVVYNSYPQEARFSGSVSRTKNISEVLRLLESTGEVHFKIKGKEVKVNK